MDKQNKQVEMNKTTEQKDTAACTSTLADMMERVKSEPKQKMLYSGIKEKSLGIIVGPSKSGKTTYCEKLAMAIASGATEFLDMPLDISNRKVLVISLEEHYSRRTERNMKQAAVISSEKGNDWEQNYIVATEEMPTYLTSDADWQLIEDVILQHAPGFVLIDSLTHMYKGSIEDSVVAKNIMKRLRDLAGATDTTIAVIHHTHKMYGQPLSIDTIAGSRVIAQELDFMIGINRTLDGKKYIKDVAFRYWQEREQVLQFEIDDTCSIVPVGEVDESALLSATDGRRDDSNPKKVIEFMQARSTAGATIVAAHELEAKFVQPQVMSKPTLYKSLRQLELQGGIIKPEKGKYAMAA